MGREPTQRSERRPGITGWRRALLAFAPALVILLVGGLAYASALSRERSASLAEQSYRTIDLLERLLSGVKDAETGQRGFLLTGEERYLEPYRRALELVPARLESLRGLVPASSAQQAGLDRLQTLLEAKRVELDAAIELRRTGGLQPAQTAVESGRGKLIMDEIRQVVAEMEETERDELERLRTAEAQRARFLLTVIAGGTLLAFVLALLVNALLARSARAQERAAAELRDRLHELRVSEARFRAVFEDAGIGIALVHPDGRILRGNPALAQMLGYSRDELEGLHFAEVTHPEDLETDETLVAELLRGERARYGIEKRYVCKGGDLIWGYLTVTLVHGPEGEPLYAVGMVEDVTAEKQAEDERQQLLQSERDARGEAERRARQEAALREAIAAVNAAFTVEETVRRIAQTALLATRADGAFVERVEKESGKAVVAAVAGEIFPELGSCIPYEGSYAEYVVEREEPVAIARVGDADRPIQHTVREQYAECSAVVVPLLDGGEPIGALVLLRTPDKLLFREDEIGRAFSFGNLASLAFRKIHLLEESERRREELEQVTESRARLMRGFSHDVKNPLGAADGYLTLLEEEITGELTQKQKESVGRVRSLLSSAVDLIGDLLDLARAEAGQLELELAPTDVRQATRLIVEEYRAQAESAGLSLEVDAPEDLPIVESDPARVRQVVSNLLSNAVKYNRPHGHIRVRVAADPERAGASGDRRVSVAVEDTGYGISPADQQALFREFSRLENAGEQKGAGIGLSIAQRIAHALGGEITLESEVDRGSVFTLWLPLREPGTGRGESGRSPAARGRFDEFQQEPEY